MIIFNFSKTSIPKNGPEQQTLSQIKVFKATANQAYVVQVNLESMKKSAQVDYVEIKLPEGVKFMSQSNSDLENQKSLQIDWKYLKNRKNLSLVVVGSKKGLRNVEIDFKSKEDKSVDRQNFLISFI
jgi:hypothetical protein